MTVPASNAVVIFMMASHVCRAITMPGCRMHSTAIARRRPNLRKYSLIVPRNKIAARRLQERVHWRRGSCLRHRASWLRECQQTGRFPLRKWHRNGPNDHFGRGLKPASLLQHEILADVAVGSFASLRRAARPRRMSAMPSMATTLCVATNRRDVPTADIRHKSTQRTSCPPAAPCRSNLSCYFVPTATSRSVGTTTPSFRSN